MGKDYLGADMRRAGNGADDKEEEKEFKALDEGDITLLKTYGQGQYSKPLKQVGKKLTPLLYMYQIKIYQILLLWNAASGLF